MYFFLLHARFEGERFAPSKAEKWIVLSIISIAIQTFLVISVGFGDFQLGTDFFVPLLAGIVANYLALVPVRMMLRMKIPPTEARFVVIIVLASMSVCVLFPLYADH